MEKDIETKDAKSEESLTKKIDDETARSIKISVLVPVFIIVTLLLASKAVDVSIGVDAEKEITGYVEQGYTVHLTSGLELDAWNTDNVQVVGYNHNEKKVYIERD